MSVNSDAATTPSQLPVVAHLFVYGTLKLGEPNEHILLGAGGRGSIQYVAIGRTIECYPLVISSRANIPFLLNRPGQGRQILGHVVCVRSREALAELDEFEACPGLYQRLPVAIQPLGPLPDAPRHAGCPLGDPADVTGGTLACQMYVYCGPDQHLLALPHLDDYRSSGDHGLPYLTELDDVRSPDQLG